MEDIKSITKQHTTTFKDILMLKRKVTTLFSRIHDVRSMGINIFTIFIKTGFFYNIFAMNEDILFSDVA